MNTSWFWLALAAVSVRTAVAQSALEQLQAAGGPMALIVPAVGVFHKLETPQSAAPLPSGADDLLDPRFLALGEAENLASKKDWQRRLKRYHGDASFAFLSPIDPARDVVVFVGGVGMTFQDAYGLARLEGGYQFAVAVVDERRSNVESGARIARAIEALMTYRAHLAASRGLPVRGELRLIGHSFGGAIAQFAVDELTLRGAIGPGRPVSRALFVAMDAPWRGVDMFWILKVPGVRQASDFLFPRLPLKKRITQGTLSIINRTGEMGQLHAVPIPPEVTTHLVAVLGPQDTSPRTRHFEPVSSWFAEELGLGELERLWKVLRRGESDMNAFDTWAFGGIIRKQGLQNLQRTLKCDADYAARAWEFSAAAREASTVEEFRIRYDVIVSEIVDAFHGHHTRFMWEDPAFMPYLHKRLVNW